MVEQMSEREKKGGGRRTQRKGMVYQSRWSDVAASWSLAELRKYQIERCERGDRSRASQQEASGLGALQTALSSDRVLGTSPPRWRCSSLPLMWNACRKSKRLVVEEKQFFIYALCLQRASPEQTAATCYIMRRQIWMCIVPGTVLQQSTNCRH